MIEHLTKRRAMTPKQMYRAMRKYNISVIYFDGQWVAGMVESWTQDGLQFEYMSPDGRSSHCGGQPVDAVEDYCNARNLEWDV